MSRSFTAAYDAPVPFADSGWCGRCVVCALRATSTCSPCGCPESRGCAGASVSPPRMVAGTSTDRPQPACLHTLGREVSHALYNKARLEQLPLLTFTQVLLEAVAMADRQSPRLLSADLEGVGLTYFQAVVLVASHLQQLVRSGELSASTTRKMVANIGSLATYMTSGLRQPLVADTTAGDLARWVDAPLGGRRRRGHPAAATTRRLRLSSARLFFRVLRHLGLFLGDPTLDIRVPHVGPTSETLALTDPEVLQLRYACVVDGHNTILPSVLALCESGATTGELPAVLISDVDLERAVVQLRGNTYREARVVPLSGWAAHNLSLRIDKLRAAGAGSNTPLIYERTRGNDPQSPGAAAAAAVHRLLALAGLAGQPGIRPRSITAWYGRRIWRDSRDIGLVKAALGCHSLDAAARAIKVDVTPAQSDVLERVRGSLLDDVPGVYQRGKRGPQVPERRKADKKRQRGRAISPGIAHHSTVSHRSTPWQVGK